VTSAVEMPDDLEAAAEVAAAELEAAEQSGEFVGFVACSDGPGRLVKVAMYSARHHLQDIPCPHCDDVHSTLAAMPRPRRDGEECDVTLARDLDNPLKTPTRGRALSGVSDDDFLAVLSTDDSPAPRLAEVLDDTGKASGMEVTTRAEWLNFDAAALLVVITRQGTPKPNLLRLATEEETARAAEQYGTERETPTPSGTGEGSRARISDAAIIAAIPPSGSVKLAEVAVGLGYASSNAAASLARRMERMNKAAEDREQSPQFIVDRRRAAIRASRTP
jgi:hypothetical protein